MTKQHTEGNFHIDVTRNQGLNFNCNFRNI